MTTLIRTTSFDRALESKAYRDGYTAARTGLCETNEENPYHRQGQPREYEAWMRGWRHGR